MQAIILAGGKGTRLKPYTLVFPKPMLPVGGIPIIDTLIRQLSYFGFTDITISLGYMGGYVKMYFEDDSNKPEGVTINYVNEDQPLGTSGPVALVDNLEEDFLVINGDILSTFDYRKFFDFHKERKADLTIAVGVKEIKMNLGVVEFENGYRIKDFREKPTYTFYDNMGIYIYNRDILNFIEKNKRLDVNDLVLELLDKNRNVCGYISEEPYYWIDVGEHADYEKANEEFQKRRNQFLKE
jgi:NDP-sugar pyrophosphorylase family protein